MSRRGNRQSALEVFQIFSERIQLGTEFNTKLDSLSPLEQVSLLGERGIWYDTIANLAKVRQQSPNDSSLDQTWQSILSAEGLELIAAQPLLDS